MENASKALLMAGGMLLAILILTLLIYAWNLFSNYQSSGDKLANIENTAKFNQQFTNYDRDDVEGYELISLVNQVVDYNERKSTEGKNDEKYNPITVTINLDNKNKDFAKESKNSLITATSYTQSNAVNTFKNLIDTASRIETRFGGNDCATKIAKNYDSIFLSDDQLKQQAGSDEAKILEAWKNAAAKFNAYSSNVKIDTTNKTAKEISDQIILHYSAQALKYYEYMQFKRGIFKCTKLLYDEKTTGRVSKIEFMYTGNIH